MAEKKAQKTTTPIGVASNKKEALETAMKNIERTYGKGSIMRLGDSMNLSVEVIPTGSLALDLALGIGGVPKGRIIEIYGPESSGKTTLALHILAQAQKIGGEVAFIDAEHALDPAYARALGVNIDELILSQPDSGEQGLNIMLMLIESGAVDLVVVDSVAALTPQVELEGEMGDLQVGAQARMMSKAMRKLAGIMNHNECTAIFINQLREKVGVMYGNPETTPGGKALKFYASVRIDIRKTDVIKNGSEIIGNKVRVKIVKNKVAPPFKQCALEIVYGKGVSWISELVDMSVEYGFLKKAGAWYSYNGEKVGQGKEAAKKFMEENADIRGELEQKLRDAMSGNSKEDNDVDIDDLPGVQEMDPDLAAMLNRGLDNPIEA